MTALEQWHRELADGKRTVHQLDALWEAAAREQADREFTAYLAPQRRYVEQLRAKHVDPPAKRARPARAPRLTKWRHALENAEADA